MVVIIGGSSHVGKTMIAQKLMEKTGYPYTSLDHLKMGFIRSGMTELTVEDDIKMRYFMWPFVSEMIKTAIENNQNLILEGCYIPEYWKDSFKDEYLKEIRCIFIVMSKEYIISHMDDIEKYSCVIENRIEDKLNVDRLVMCSENFKNDCIANGTKYIEIDEEYNIEKLLKEILNEVV